METENTNNATQEEADRPLSEREMMIAYYSYARGVLDGKGLPVIPMLAEAFSLYGISEGQGKAAQDLWDPFIDSETGTAILAEAGIY